VLFGLGGFLVLVATLSATGLALTDARPDFATLAAVGAAPRTRRFMAMGTAAVVAGGGALLGVLVGIVPGAAVAYPMLGKAGSGSSEPVIEIPWLLLGALPLLVPLLAVAVTGCRCRSAWHRRVASLMTTRSRDLGTTGPSWRRDRAISTGISRW
jgi:putative ABC transport system permease protein